MSGTEDQPLVTVVTPVYNGAAYLAEAIESVLAQTYGNWEYVILDNASTDETPDIAQRFAKADSRIRYTRNDRVLSQFDNWNASMRLLSSDSRYCKVLHADDLLLPACLERMVDVAERHPSAVLIGAYRIDGERVNMASIPYPREFVPGLELGRQRLLGYWEDLFGSPSSIMYRADRVRERGDCFYGLENPHTDTAVCFELLREGDYAFVHQVLTYTRRHAAAETVEKRRLGTYSLGRIMIARDLGGCFLEEAEHRYAMELQLRYHYASVAANLRRLLLDSAYRSEQLALFASCGSRLSLVRVLTVFARQWLRELLGRLRSSPSA